MNSIVKEINLLINYEIRDDEVLSKEEKDKRKFEFKKNLSFKKYSYLFDKIKTFLEDEKNLVEDKDLVIQKTFELIGYYIQFNDNIKDAPDFIKYLYSVNDEFKKVTINIERLSEITSPPIFNEMINLYFEFLDNPNYEFYIHNYYSKIDNFNKIVLNYLNEKSYNGLTHEENLDPEIVYLFKNKMNSFNNNR